jgi:hypothetical protein
VYILLAQWWCEVMQTPADNMPLAWADPSMVGGTCMTRKSWTAGHVYVYGNVRPFFQPCRPEKRRGADHPASCL